MQKLLIVGCGDVGSRLATQLLDKGWQVYGLRRSIDRLPAGVIGVAGDLFNEACPADWPTEPIDYLVYSATATERNEAGSIVSLICDSGERYRETHHCAEWLKKCALYDDTQTIKADLLKRLGLSAS